MCDKLCCSVARSGVFGSAEEVWVECQGRKQPTRKQIGFLQSDLVTGI